MAAVILPFVEALQDADTTAALDADGDLTTCADWARTWHAAFGTPADLLVRSGSAALPLTIERRRGSRVLRSFTNGHSQRSLTGSPAPGTAEGLVQALVARGGWDMVHVQGLSMDWATAFARAGRKSGLAVNVEHESTQLTADLSGDRELFLNGRSRSTFKRKAQLERAMRRSHHIRFVEPPPDQTMSRYLAAEQQSWKAERGELLSASPQIESFYRTLATNRFANEGRPWIVTLQSGEHMIAGILFLRNRQQAVALKSFYDRDFARFSPGFVLLRHCIERLVEQRLSGRLDFYSGRSAYEPFATGLTVYQDLVLWAPTTRARMLRVARRALHRSRTARRFTGIERPD